MKYSFVALAAMATAVMATPTLLNSAFDVEEGKPFEIKYSGCEGGCTIVLQNGESTNLKDVQTLTSSASGDSFTFTPSGLPSDTYNFKITNNANGESNYSSQWEYKGTGTLPSSTVTATVTATTPHTSTVATTETKSATVTASGVTSVSLTTVTSAATTITSASKNTETITATLSHSTNGTTISTVRKPSATQSEEHKSTAPAASASVTSVPNSGASHLTASFALVAGAVMAMVYLN
jgi:hypothetical protein